MALETVEIETPAAAAISFMVVMLGLLYHSKIAFSKIYHDFISSSTAEFTWIPRTLGDDGPVILFF
jgi:hypothetical protein